MRFFRRREFACRCGCGFDTVDYKLAEILDKLRNDFDTFIIITNGAICHEHNKTVNKDIQHTYGKAADIKVYGISPKEVYDYLDHRYPDTFGIGLYDRWTHIDVRENRARWQG